METRDRLVESALRLLETDGLAGLNVRRLAAEIGTSTMVVYSNFGGMAGLYEAVAQEAFARLARALRTSPISEDAIADLLIQAMVYRRFAHTDPHRYNLMFGVTAPGAGPLIGKVPTSEDGLATLADVNAAFREVVTVVRRCTESGRLHPTNAVSATGQMWSLLHGYVMLELTGAFGTGDQGVTRVFAPSAINLLVGLGGDRAAMEQSAITAISYFKELPARPITAQTTPTTAARRGRRPRPTGDT